MTAFSGFLPVAKALGCASSTTYSLGLVDKPEVNYVWTKIKCRGSFLKSNSSEKLQNNFSLNDQSPMCFWFGNGVIDSKAVKFRNESKSKV